MLKILAAFALLMAATPAVAKPPAPAAILASAPFKQTEAALDRDYDRFVTELIALTEIAAPPFKEAKRATVFAEHFRTLGLRDVAIDSEGNVVGLRPGTDPKLPYILVSAHLDTVFPEGTKVTVRREGSKLHAPGVGDDTRGLATMLAYIRALDAAKIRTRRGILFVGTVGEEGLGDLRGARFLLTRSSYKERIAGFFSLDGDDPARVTHRAVGSRRYRVTFKGPGGHSYGAFGIVNPMAAMANAIAELYRLPVPVSPKTTYSASVTGGGTSVNAIPSEVFVEIDMRSEDSASLADLDRRFLAVVQGAVDAENKARSTLAGSVSFEAKLLGERPAGATPADAPIVRAAQGAAIAMGLKPVLAAASTDANVAMSLGVPAVTIGYGGVGGRSHSLDEFVDVAKPESLKGMKVGLLATLAMAEIQLR
jgi:acetylornithine deacetylase/succinyl-diaminopimelate desuccinylase-like protein